METQNTIFQPWFKVSKIDSKDSKYSKYSKHSKNSKFQSIQGIQKLWIMEQNPFLNLIRFKGGYYSRKYDKWKSFILFFEKKRTEPIQRRILFEEIRQVKLKMFLQKGF